MSESFEIVLSKTIAPEALATSIAQLIPGGVETHIRMDVDELPNEEVGLWALVVSTEDPAWPCVFNVMSCDERCELGAYPDLRLADHLCDTFGTDALCGTYPFVGELDPLDPYWSLARVAKKWYLASTVGTQLMGPYTDGHEHKRGTEPIRLVRPVTIPN